MAAYGEPLLRRAAGTLLLVFVVASAAAPLALPARLRVVSGQPASLPMSPALRAGPLESGFPGEVARQGSRLHLRMGRPGTVRIALLLWGRFPVGTLVIDVVPPLHLMAGGQAIGILQAEQGLRVQREEGVRDPSGIVRHPAREAGLVPGDVLLEADGRLLREPAELSQHIQHAGQAGQEIRLKVRRGERIFLTRLKPVAVACEAPTAFRRAPCEGRFTAGLVVEEPQAGVGTLTFYDPRTLRFGALGHLVQDRQRRALSLEQARVVVASIGSVSRGLAGRPGEKVGRLERDQPPLGVIRKNTPAGIFGDLYRTPRPAPGFEKPLPVALAGDVREGEAHLLTVVEGERVESFRVQIVRIRPRGVPESQRLLVRVVDPRLLALTGGIVQGMSGSPLIQDNRLVGAVTHVSVQDPARGYGILIESMLEQSGLWESAEGGAGAVRNTEVSRLHPWGAAA